MVPLLVIYALMLEVPILIESDVIVLTKIIRFHPLNDHQRSITFWRKMKETGCDVFCDIHGDEEIPYNFLASHVFQIGVTV